MGRHPTILDIRGGVRCRIPLRISLDRSNPLNLNFFDHFWTKNHKKSFMGGKKNAPARNAAVALEGLEPKSSKHKQKHDKCIEMGSYRSVWGFDTIDKHKNPLRSHWDTSRAPKQSKKVFSGPWAPGPLGPYRALGPPRGRWHRRSLAL